MVSLGLLGGDAMVRSMANCLTEKQTIYITQLTKPIKKIMLLSNTPQVPPAWHQMVASWCVADQDTERVGLRWYNAAPASFPGAAQSAASSARTQLPFIPAEYKMAQTRPNWLSGQHPNESLDRRTWTQDELKHDTDLNTLAKSSLKLPILNCLVSIFCCKSWKVRPKKVQEKKLKSHQHCNWKYWDGQERMNTWT